MSSAIYSDGITQEFPYANKVGIDRKIMIHFMIALMFPISSGFYFFGLAMVRALSVCIITCILTEMLCNRLTKHESTIGDLTALATGAVIALNMRPGLGVYPMVLASILGITVGKYIFGGAGFNPINPAVVGRLLPVAGFPGLWATSIRPTIPTLMSKANLSYWEATQYTFVRDVTTLPFYYKIKTAQPAYVNYHFSNELNTNYDVLSGTSYLEIVKNWYKGGVMPQGMEHTSELFDHWALFFGNMPGVLGETAKWSILLGFIYLVVTKVISPMIPLLIWGLMGVFGWVFSATRLGPVGVGPLGFFSGDPLIWILVGGVMFGSVYMETDPVSSPRTTQAKILYSLLFVSIVTSIRLVFSFPEGVSFALLSSNLMIPLIDRLCDPKNKFAQQIKTGLMVCAAASVIFLTSMFVYTKFFKIPIHEVQIQQTLLDKSIGEIIVKAFPNGDKYYVINKKDGSEFGKAFVMMNKEYNSENIMSMIIIGDGIVQGISILDSSVQPIDLSQLVTEHEFLDQFIGKTQDDIFIILPVYKRLDMVSGSTYSSDSILLNIKQAFDLYNYLQKNE